MEPHGVQRVAITEEANELKSIFPHGGGKEERKPSEEALLSVVAAVVAAARLPPSKPKSFV